MLHVQHIHFYRLYRLLNLNQNSHCFREKVNLKGKYYCFILSFLIIVFHPKHHAIARKDLKLYPINF